MNAIEKRRVEVNRRALLFIVERVVAAPDLEVMRALIPGLFCENTGISEGRQ